MIAAGPHQRRPLSSSHKQAARSRPTRSPPRNSEDRGLIRARYLSCPEHHPKPRDVPQRSSEHVSDITCMRVDASVRIAIHRVQVAIVGINQQVVKDQLMIESLKPLSRDSLTTLRRLSDYLAAHPWEG